MRTVALANQKGGVGKTTTAVNLAAAVAQRGQRVLLIDLDPQGNASMHLLGPAVGELDITVYEVLQGKVSAQSAIRPVESTPGLDVLPSNLDLAAAEAEFLGAVARERILTTALEGIEAHYDLAMLDTPPSLGLLTINALTAADFVVVPVQVHFFALAGLSVLRGLIERLRQTRVNPGLSILGIVPTFYDARETLTHEIMEKLRGAFGELVTEIVIRRNTDTARAAGWAQAIVTAAPGTLGGQDYQALATELLARMERKKG
jgi:chromosome partitioning protein